MLWHAIVTLGLVLGMASNGLAATAHVKHDNARNSGSTSTLSITITGGTTSGNTVLGTFAWMTTTVDITSVTVCGNTATLPDATTTLGTTMRARSFYYANVGTGACTVTLTLDGTATDVRGIAHEASGIDTADPFDQAACAGQSAVTAGTDVLSSGAVTVGSTGQYIYGFTSSQSGTTSTAGTGFTQAVDIGTRSSEYIADWGSSGSKAAVFTADGSGDNWMTCILTMKATSAGGASNSGLLLFGVGN